MKRGFEIFISASLFFFASQGRAAALTQQDYRHFAKYYSEHGLWSAALDFTKKTLFKEESTSEDYQLHAFVLWNYNSPEKRREAVRDYLLELNSKNLSADQWKALWDEYQSKVMHKETVRDMGVLAETLQKTNCPDQERALFDQVPEEDRESRLYVKNFLLCSLQCQEWSPFFKAWEGSLKRDPFWSFHLEIAKSISKLSVKERFQNKSAILQIARLAESGLKGAGPSNSIELARNLKKNFNLK